ncbi:MAG: L-glutamate gamma-semialdehyde dehydrogenase, partial [Candidatus Heimdallarchaeaceae archaeon]
MNDGVYQIPKPKNEPILDFLPGSNERKELKEALDFIREKFEIPLIIDGIEIKTEVKGTSVPPHNHQYVLAEYNKAGIEEVDAAIEAALNAKADWENMHWADRASIFLKAADLMAGPYRQIMNAATMLGVSKNVYQAEVDVVEMIDFFRFNAHFMQEIYSKQPESPEGQWNRLEYRPLEGFVFAITPFNFISIAGNLPTTPALLGNTVIWKPASSAVYPSYYIMSILMEAGLPHGVINFVPGQGAVIAKQVLNHRDLAGVHFTGSTGTFQWIWRKIGENISTYRTYPRIVGETGGKDFIVAHPSANIDEVSTALIRGAFEFQGQKCSAASRAYIPQSMWDQVKMNLIKATEEIKQGDVEDFTTFMNAVIDQPAFNNISKFIDFAKNSEEAEIITGGKYDDSKGYFIEPTTIVTSNPKFRTMEEEIFGPVLTIYVYQDDKFKETLDLCNDTSPYALTGSIFAKDKQAIQLASKILRNAAGNFYINDKPTGAVVGQQPFGGARASGTNDKAGSYLNL